jgi:hypothetical protein
MRTSWHLTWTSIAVLVAACATEQPAAGPMIGHAHIGLHTPTYLPYPAGVSLPAQSGSATHAGVLANSVDFSAARGQPVLAVAAGVVTDVHDACADNGGNNCFNNRTNDCGCNHGHGNEIIVDHGDGWYSAYLHLNPGSLRVAVGDTVCQGVRLADSGHTGFGSGPHMHFHFQNVPVNVWERANGATLAFDDFQEGRIPARWANMVSQNQMRESCAPPDWWCPPLNRLRDAGVLARSCPADFDSGTLFNKAEWALMMSGRAPAAEHRSVPDLSEPVPGRCRERVVCARGDHRGLPRVRRRSVSLVTGGEFRGCGHSNPLPSCRHARRGLGPSDG